MQITDSVLYLEKINKEVINLQTLKIYGSVAIMPESQMAN